MADHSTTFLLATVLAFATIIIVASMKYFAAGRTARLQLTGTSDNQSLSAELADIKARLVSIEKILREVE